MAFYIVRIEFEKDVISDYKKLVPLMIANGFTKNIKGEDGIEYLLPSANYGYNGSDATTTNQVLNLAENAAFKIGKKVSVIVTKSAGSMFSGLKLSTAR